MEKFQQTIDILNRIVFDSDEPIVVALSGAWGVGKTYFWKNAVMHNEGARNSIYVSVFGAKSIDEIRQRVIFESIRKPWLLPLLFGKRYKYILSALLWFRNKIQRIFYFGPILIWLIESATTFLGIFVLRWPELIHAFFIPQALSVQYFEKAFLKWGLVICLDDIERLPESVGIENLLGYVNELKENFHTKVVLIHNEEKLGENNEEIFKKYEEKIIDRKLPFCPDLIDIIKLVFSEIADKKNSNLTSEKILSWCQTLSMSNIRLLKKTQFYFEEIFSALPSNPNQKFTYSVFHSLFLFIWIKNTPDNAHKVNFNVLENYSYMSYLMTRKDEEKDPPYELLKQYDYLLTDDLDLLLIDYVKTDILNTEKLLAEYNRYLTESSSEVLQEQFRNVWGEYYHSTLSNNECEFCAALEGITKNYINQININEFDSVLTTLVELDRNAIADELLNLFKASRHQTLGKFSREMLHSSIKHAGFDAYLKMIDLENAKDERPIEEVIKSATEEDFIYEKDRKRLAKFSADDFFNYFTSKNQPHLTSMIRELFRKTDMRGSDEREAKTHQNLLKTVQRIAGMYRINKMRMQSMGLIDADKGENGKE